MHTHKQKNKKAEVKEVTQKKTKSAVFQFEDNRPETLQRRQMQQRMNNTPKSGPVVQQKTNNTGLPDHLKAGIENLSGHAMDDVKVHYNSPKPAQLQAHAYAQGSQIHLGPGQEKHLPHEAWHVVQQKQGRVKPTAQLKENVAINDDHHLEREADVMGAKAFQLKSRQSEVIKKTHSSINGKTLQQKPKPKVSLTTSLVTPEHTNAPVQGIFTVSVNPGESPQGIIIKSVQVGERPATEFGSNQKNHSIPWKAVLAELEGAVKGKTPETAFDAVVYLAAERVSGLNLKHLPHPKERKESAMKIADVKHVIEVYLEAYNKQQGIAHEDSASFTKASSARYAPHNAGKLSAHEKGEASLNPQALVELLNKVIEQLVTASDPGKTKHTEAWANNAASTFAHTAVFILEGKGIEQYIDFILNMVPREAVTKMKLEGLLVAVFMKKYIEVTKMLLEQKGWTIE